MDLALPAAVFIRAAFAISILGASTSAAAQSSAGHPCAAIQDAGGRLACYDRAFPPAAGSSSLVDVEAERKRARANFGLSGEQKRQRDPERETAVAPTSIDAKVSHVGYTAEGYRVIALDNNQTWRLTENTSKGRLSVGDRVTVRKAALGSYMLVTPGGVALRARRIR